MPTELEELVEFLHHGNTQIRQIAAENLVGYSTEQPSLFKRNQLEPVKDLKLLIKDYTPIAKNALHMLVNISEDSEVLKNLSEDDVWLESLLRRITDVEEPNADLMCMLLANLAKSPNIDKLLTLKREVPKPLSVSPFAVDQLLDCFVKGAEGKYNKNADYDYLSYLFADLSKHEAGRQHFLSPSNAESSDVETVIPLTKLIVFTEHRSTIRRRGVASTIKNVCFDLGAHAALLTSEGEDVKVDDDEADAKQTHHVGIGLLPYILLPLMGSEEYDDEDTDGMLDECQLLPPDKQRETQADIIRIHLETLLLLTTTKVGRLRLREVKVYPIVRELHGKEEDDGIREGCDQLVQVLMRGEEGDPVPEPPGMGERVTEVVEDEDEQIVEIL